MLVTRRVVLHAVFVTEGGKKDPAWFEMPKN